MKRYIPLAVVAVLLLVWGGVSWYTRDKPDPEPPDPAPSVSIVGPQNVKAGELIVYTTPDENKYKKWTTVPDGPQIKVTNEGHVLVIVFDLPGKYHLILASSSFQKGVELEKFKVTVGGEGPDPPRPPPLPPGPDPEPDGTDTAAWIKWSKAAALKMSYSGLKNDCSNLAGQLSALAAQIAAGAVKDEAAARVQLRQLTNKTLGRNAKYWVEFSKTFAIRSEKLEGLLQHRAVYAAVSIGLQAASVALENPYQAAIGASREDRRSVVVIITSAGCPPCERLKSEWLPNTKVLEDARVVMLDRDKHKEVVEQIATTGMMQSVKVPQIQIVRYVNGTWRQFSKVGYLGAASLDRWVRNVLTWEEKP